MSVGICLVRAGLPAPDVLSGLLHRCGLSVWTPDADDGQIYAGSLCIVIDMPGDAGFRTLKLFRDYGIETPVVLVVDPGLEKAAAGAKRFSRVEVLRRETQPREILRRIEAFFPQHRGTAVPSLCVT